MKFDNTLTVTVNALLNTGSIPFLNGEAGIGKSSWVMALAEERNTQCFTTTCNQLGDKSDLTVPKTVPTPKKDDYMQKFFPHATIQRAIDYAVAHPNEKPILFLDELNRTTSDITSALLSLTTARMLGNVTLPNNLLMIAAGNDKGNITPLDSASISRFWTIHVIPDYDTFLRVNPDLNELIRKTLAQNPEKYLLCKQDENTIDDDIDPESLPFTTPRTISALSRWLNAVPRKDLINICMLATSTGASSKTEIYEIITGFTGETEFSKVLLSNLTREVEADKLTMTKKSSTAYSKKPKFLTELETKATIDEVVEAIEDATLNNVSDSLAYTLAHMQDNGANNDTRIFETLVRKLKPEKLAGKTLASLQNAYMLPAVDRPVVDRIKDLNPQLYNLLQSMTNK